MKRTYHPILILTASTMLVWGMTVAFDFVWDDYAMIAQNSSLHHWGTLWTGWFRDFWMLHDSPQVSGYWRPIPTMVHVLLTKITGGPAFVFHLFNVVLHGLTAFFFYQFLIHMKWVRWFWISILFFLWHPLASETVSFNSAVPDLLSAMFGWWAVSIWTKAHNPKTLFKTIVLLCLSFLSKESGIFFAFFILGIDWILRKDERSEKHRALVAASFVIVAGYIALHIAITKGVGSRTMWGGSVLSHLATVCKLFAYELFLIFAPISSSPTREFAIGAWNQWQVWFGLLLLVSFIGAFVHYQRTKPTWAFCIFFYLVFWFPISNIIPAEGLIANRYLYATTMAVAVAVGACFNRLSHFPKLAGLGLIAWALWAMSESVVWKNSETLWKHATEVSPLSSVAWNEWGNVQLSRKNYQLAYDSYHRAVGLQPMYRDASFNKSVARFAMNDGDALPTIQEHLKKFPNDARAFDLLGSYYDSKGDMVQAETFTLQAVNAEPMQWKYRYNLANGYIRTKKYDQAIEQLQKVSELVDRPDVIKSLAGAYCLNGQYKSCLEIYEKFTRIFPERREEVETSIQQTKQLLELTGS